MTAHCITLGADPEFFLRDSRTGAVVPAVGLIGGTKGQPLQIPGARPGFTMQEDNVMVEFNIPPVEDEYGFTDAIQHALACLDAYIESKTEGKLERDVRPSRLFSHRALAHPQAMTFGCSPDFNAYNGGMAFETVNPRALEEPDGAWRFSGGHIHVGYTNYLPYSVPPFVVAHFLDLFLGTPMMKWEQLQGKRGELYGLPGRFRPTSYGLEYRSLSNMWVHDLNIAQLAASRVAHTMAFIKECTEDQLATLYGQIPWPSLRAALTSYSSRQVGEVRGFISSSFRRHPIARYL